MTLKKEDMVKDFGLRLGSEIAAAPCWSIQKAKNQFSRVVNSARDGEVQVVENQRERDGEVVFVISRDRLKQLFEPDEDRVADFFKPDENLPTGKPLLIGPRSSRKARIKL